MIQSWIEIKFTFDHLSDPTRGKEQLLVFFANHQISNIVESYFDGLASGLSIERAQETISSESDALPLIVYFENSEKADACLALLSARFPDGLSLLSYQTRQLTDADFASAWSESTVFATEQLVLGPADLEQTSGKKQIKIITGSAFGNGQHVTTIAMLRALEQLPVTANTRVLDVGTGCGVLLVAAGMLGAGSLKGTDLSDEIVSEARRNLRLNGIEADVLVTSAMPTGDEPFHVILANIPVTALRPLIPQMLEVAHPDAVFIFSGFTVVDGRQYLPELNSVGLYLRSIIEESGWVALVCERRHG